MAAEEQRVIIGTGNLFSVSGREMTRFVDEVRRRPSLEDDPGRPAVQLGATLPTGQMND
jgi:hypothetical protein